MARYTQFNLPVKKPIQTDVYRKEENIYKYQYVDGVKMLVKVGVEDIYTPIQLAKEGTYLPLMIDRILNGRTTDLEIENYLNNSSWSSIDTTTLPKNRFEYQEYLNSANSIYDQLPKDLKQQFSNSKELFVKELTEGIAFEKITAFNQKNSVDNSTAFKKVADVQMSKQEGGK